jgi:hypothetical protein
MHGFDAGFENIDLINFLMTDLTHCKADGLFFNDWS